MKIRVTIHVLPDDNPKGEQPIPLRVRKQGCHIIDAWLTPETKCIDFELQNIRVEQEISVGIGQLGRY